MLKTTIRNKHELKAAYEKYRIQQELYDIVVTPQMFVQIIFSDDVRFYVDHEMLLASFCEEESEQLVH